jgi:UDP-GlcNAc:undecaprenyl-phosphate GlcNAc-1-phosphate transferase
VRFPSHIYLLAVISACLTSLASLPLWRKWCLRVGLVDDPGHRKIHDQPVPLAGGLALMTGLVLPTVAACALLFWLEPHHGATAKPDADAPSGETLSLLDARSTFLLQYGLGRRGIELAAIIVGAFGILAVGWLDDKHELRPAAKFTGQVLVALLVAASGARITLFVPSQIFSYAITVLWILTVINAFNFMDNMNGLCAGLGAIGSWYFARIASLDGQYLVALIAFLTFGALLGFLPYNFPRAVAFLGDAGSHLTGYLLAVLAILPHFYSVRHPRQWAVLVPLLVLAVPLFDMVWVVVLRWQRGQPFYEGDTNHLSHRLVRAGCTRTQAVLAIWALAVVFGSLAYLC